MAESQPKNRDRQWAILLGAGLALSPIHNSWLTSLLTNDKGETLLFLPAVAYVILIIGTWMFLLNNWERVKTNKIDWVLVVPMLVIAVSMGVSGFVNGDGFGGKASPLFMGVFFISIYFTARVLGQSLFYMLVPGIIVGSVSLVASGIIHPGQYTGGFITNYCASAGYLILGAIFARVTWQWVVVLIAAVGLFFTGSLEAFFIAGVIFVTILARRDMNRRMLIVLASVLGLILIWGLGGYLTQLYTGNGNISALAGIVTGNIPMDSNSASALTSGRWPVIVEALAKWSWIGHGFSLSTTGGGIVHNIPLIIVHQIGPAAAVAWLFATIWCLVKTKWKYAWIAVLAVSVWDHYLWTQFAPFWWCLVGVSTVSAIPNDYIFKKVAA